MKSIGARASHLFVWIRILAMPDLLIFLLVSLSMGIVLVDAWSGSKQRASVLPSLSEVVIT